MKTQNEMNADVHNANVEVDDGAEKPFRFRIGDNTSRIKRIFEALENNYGWTIEEFGNFFPAQTISMAEDQGWSGGRKTPKTPLGITELCRRVGDNNIKLQIILTDMTNISVNKKGVSKITFCTNQLTPTEVMNGKPKMTGLVIWLPTDLVEKARLE